MKSIGNDKTQRRCSRREKESFATLYQREVDERTLTSEGDRESILSSRNGRSSKEMNLEEGTIVTSKHDVETGSSEETASEGDRRSTVSSNNSPTSSSLTNYDIKLILSNCVVGWRFIIAIYLWACQFIAPPGDYRVNRFSWHHVIFGIPTACVIVIWKTMELVHRSKNTEKDCCRIPLVLPLLSLIGSLLFLTGSILSWTGINLLLVVFLWVCGWGALILANVLEAIVAGCETIMTCCKEGILSAVTRIVAHILQALAFASFTPSSGLNMFNLNIAWIGLFFILEGIIICTLNEPKALPFWSMFFKVLTAFSFWATSANFDWYGSREEILIAPSLKVETSDKLQWIVSLLIPEGRKESIPIEVNYILPLMLLLTAFFFDTQKISTSSIFFTCALVICFLASFYLNLATEGVMFTSLILFLWSFFKWVRVCWVRAGKPNGSTAIRATLSVIWSIIKLPWTLIVRCMQQSDNLRHTDTQMSIIDELEDQPYGEAFHVVACALLVIQTFMVRVEEPEYLPIMLVSIGTGIFYLMFSICCIKTEYGITERDVPKYILAEDTYTLMMYSRIFSQTWLIGLAVFLLQATLTWMILAAQFFGQEVNVPFDVSFSTRIGQVAGMVLIIFFQNDYWVASTLLEISFLGRTKNLRGLKIAELEEDAILTRKLQGNVNLESANPSKKFRKKISVFFPSIIRLFQCIGVIAASTGLIIQSDNIIDLVKDYTAIFFISEIDDFVFTLAAQGYIGDALKKSAKTAEATCVSDVNQHPFRLFGFVSIFSIMISCWIYVTTNQSNGEFFRRSHGACFDKVGWQNLNAGDFGDGNCNADLNFEECGFDNGDCLVENLIHEQRNVTSVAKYMNCNVTWKSYIGNGRCDGYPYNTPECDYDGGDCEDFNDLYPNCNVTNPFRVGDGICDGEIWRDPNCGYDGGDCNFTQGLF